MGNSRPLAPWMVWTATASASDSRRRRALSPPRSSAVGDLLAEPADRATAIDDGWSACQPWSSSATWRRSLSRRSPPTVREQAGGEAASSCSMRRSSGGDRPRAQRRGPVVQRARRRRSQSASVAVASRGGIPADERARARRRGRGWRRRLLERVQQVEPVAGRPRWRSTLSPPWTTAGTPTAWSASRTVSAVAVGAGEHGDVARATTGAPVDGRAGGEDADGLGGEVARR